jgi:hypothetical protein
VVVVGCEDWRLGEELTGEWRTVVVLDRNSSEGGASGGWRWWSGRGERLGEVWRSRGGTGEEWVMGARTSGESAVWWSELGRRRG